MVTKKIRLDFSKTEERSGWNTRQMPEGIHKMKIDAVQVTEAQDGTDMLVYALVPTDPRFKSRRFPFYCKLQQNQLWKLRDLLVAAGQTVPKKATSIDPNSIVGKLVAAEVEDEMYQGNPRSQVQGTYGLAILDEDGSIGSEDADEDDEDYEDEAAEDSDEEYEDEAEEDEDDEEEEDLSALSLPELRKRAKAAGVDTAGLKKAELVEAIEEAEAEEEDDEDDDELEDDDLDEDELYDDEEDEEEEPAPAPKRRPAAKAAPAKRAVKRR
jgi:hypothetical protein